MLEKQNITALILAAGRGTRLPNETHIPNEVVVYIRACGVMI